MRSKFLSGSLTLLIMSTVLSAVPLAQADEDWDVHSDTWVATDALGRILPSQPETGPPRAGKFVGMFYFLWLQQYDNIGPFDVSKILEKDPTAIRNPNSPLWGPPYYPHHWGESLFGYYLGDDEAVLRKHAQMLSDSGVDAIFFDVTNQLTYPHNWQALCRVFDSARRAGNHVPRIGFLCPFGDPRKVVHELYDQLYGPGLYPELWFRWEDKPLILADPSFFVDFVSQEKHSSAPAELVTGHTLGQTFTVEKSFEAVGGSFPTWATTGSQATLSLHRGGPGGDLVSQRRLENIRDNAWALIELDAPAPPGDYYLELSQPKGRVGWWTEARDVWPKGQAFADGKPASGDRTLMVRLTDGPNAPIRRFFTFRKPMPDYFKGPSGPEQWSWLEVTPQHTFYKTPGVPEQMSVGVAQNATDGKLSVLSNPRSHGRSFHDGAEPKPEGQDFFGRNFNEQWQQARKIDPAFVFVTGWNEWIAGRFGADAPFYGSGPVTFVDEFNAEFSRDIEPMKGGHGDSYYYQFIANVRKYKGVRPIEPVKSQKVTIDGPFDDWKLVQPEFRDTIGDPVHRDHSGWGKQLHYVNKTGRNDIVAAKASIDEKDVSFYVRTRDALTSPTDPNWMLLFIDTDANVKTGWLGYDYVINRQTPHNGKAVIEKNVGGKYEWGSPREVDFRTAGNEIELAVPRSVLGIAKLPATIDFKWADGIQQTGEWSDFTLNGDVAPNDRFNYRATFREVAR